MKGTIAMADGQQTEKENEERELQIHREESSRLSEANEKWFEQYEKEFRAVSSRNLKKKKG